MMTATSQHPKATVRRLIKCLKTRQFLSGSVLMAGEKPVFNRVSIGPPINGAAECWCPKQGVTRQAGILRVAPPIRGTSLTTKEAFDELAMAMVSDPQYAWAWHCNIAMAAYDEGMDHASANRAANRFMQSCFGVDTKESV